MATLQEVTDYGALVFMALMVIGLISLIILVINIKHTIDDAKHKIEQNVKLITHLPYIGKYIYKTVKDSLK
jgi:hypothetical protein